jgi:hypothetical protein
MNYPSMLHTFLYYIGELHFRRFYAAFTAIYRCPNKDHTILNVMIQRLH